MRVQKSAGFNLEIQLLLDQNNVSRFSHIFSGWERAS